MGGDPVDRLGPGRRIPPDLRVRGGLAHDALDDAADRAKEYRTRSNPGAVGSGHRRPLHRRRGADVLVSRVRLARRDGVLAPQRRALHLGAHASPAGQVEYGPPRVTPFVLVTGDFVHTGGMDAANFALARYLGRTGAGVHLVAHRADAELRSMPNVSFHHVTKPGGSYLLGALLLRRAGERWARRLAPAGARQVVNGGNCISADTNWVHYVHAAHEPLVAGAPVRLAMRRWMHRRYLTEERQALRRARLVIANSNRTRTDVIDRVGVPPARVRTVYYGTDPTCHRPPTTEERRAARQALGWSDDAPGIAFVGALGDRRKGFDTVFAAWEQVSADATW